MWWLWVARRRAPILGHVLAIIAVAWILEGAAHDPAFVLRMSERIDSLPVIHQMDEILVTAIRDFMNATAERITEALSEAMSGRGDGGVPAPLLPPAPPSPPAPAGAFPWGSGRASGGGTVVVVPGGSGEPPWRSAGPQTVVVAPGGSWRR